MTFFRKLLIPALLVGAFALFFFLPKDAPVELTLGAITASSTIYSTAGTQTYVVSTNACEQTIEAWGAGGAGGLQTNNGGGGGGGGGYARATTTSAVGTSHTLVIAAATASDSVTRNDSTYDTTVVVAQGGAGSGTNAAGTGGTVNTGGVTANGANGGAGNTTDDNGGGGGGAGGPDGAGGIGEDGATTVGQGGLGGTGNGTLVAGGTRGNAGVGGVGTSNAKGGAGGGGGDNGFVGGSGGAPGGGGGGGEAAGGQAGAAGQIKVTEWINSLGCGSAPTVTTDVATVVTETAGTIGGSITDNGQQNANTRGFATSTASNLSSSVSTSTESGSFGVASWTAAFSNSALTSNTTYYFRAWATNGFGTGLGSIRSFLTLPGAPTSLTLGSITTTAITASWVAPATGATTYNLERCATGTQTCTLTTLIAGTSQQATSLTQSTSYDFAVQAVNATGAGAFTATSSATTLTPSTIRDGRGTIKNIRGTIRLK